MELKIFPVGADNAAQYLDFFDTRAFCDNPEWAGCYCVFNHFAGGEAAWMARTAAQNRADAESMIREGSLKGYLAYDAGDRAVGWCNVNDKHAYPLFSKAGEDTGERVCAVTCFMIDPDFRRQGVARALLRRACADYAALGYDYMESYPVAGEDTCAAHYHGHPAMYEGEGFAVYLQLKGRVCMGKPLK
jgi:ribosomal protein S18 acetylase RimI-like enzyme